MSDEMKKGLKMKNRMKKVDVKIYSNRYKLSSKQRQEIIDKINSSSNIAVEYTQTEHLKPFETKIDNIIGFIKHAKEIGDNIVATLQYIDVERAYLVIGNEDVLKFCLKMVGNITVDYKNQETISDVKLTGCYVI